MPQPFKEPSADHILVLDLYDVIHACTKASKREYSDESCSSFQIFQDAS
jgi:hypothetical protein